jgi:glycosyltransferase involved in cell wall biosynthesis
VNMRVAYNARALSGPLTGVGQYTYQLALRLAAMQGLDLFLFYGSRFERKVEAVSGRAGLNRMKVRQLGRRFVPFAYDVVRAWRQLAFARGLRSERIELYHEPNTLALDVDAPLVLTVHDLSWIRHPETHPAERVRAMNKYFEPGLRRATVVLTDSEFVKREIVEVFGVAPDRVRAIPIGMDPIFHPLPDAELQRALETHGLRPRGYLLNVGTLEPRKNLERTVRAYTLLPQALRKHFPLVLVGASGWRTQGIESIIAPLVARGEVKVLGYLAREELAAVMAGAAAMAYPSLYEGFGLPPLEAMGCGVPVIASATSSLPEVVGDAGLQVDPLDVDAIANAMRTMLEDAALRSRLSALSIERAARFTWEACAAQTFKAYQDALATSR